MEFLGTGVSGNLGDVGGVQTGAGHDNDVIGGSSDELAESCGTFGCTVGAAGSEDAGGASLDDVVERATEIGSVVEGAVEGDLEGTSGFNEFAGTFDVHGVVGTQDAKCNAIKSEIAGNADIAEHDGKFDISVDEIAGTWADDGEDGNFQFLVDFAEGGDRRSDASVDKLAAEFDAVGSTAFGGEGGV